MAPKKRKLYSEVSMLEAIASIRNGMKLKEAAEKFDIPISTLSDKKNGKYSEDKNSPGPKATLSREREHHLVKFLLSMSKIGYGISKKELPQLVKASLDAVEDKLRIEGANIPPKRFQNNLPTFGWVYRFLARWPQLASRMPENLGHQRVKVTEPIIREWFQTLEKYLLDEHGWHYCI